MVLPRGLYLRSITTRPINRGARTVPGVDDAGGGRRGLRAMVSAELWGVLAARWAIPRQPGRDLGCSLNLNLLVSHGAGQLVVRVHRPPVSPARLEAVQAVRDRLDAAGVPCSALVPARDGARWARAGDRLVEVERFIPHDGAMNTPGRLARGLSLPGRLDTLLAGMDVAPPGRTAEFATWRRAARHSGWGGPDQKLAPHPGGAAHGQPGGAAGRARHSRRSRAGGGPAAAADAR
jgi:hypothetical protein